MHILKINLKSKNANHSYKRNHLKLYEISIDLHREIQDFTETTRMKKL